MMRASSGSMVVVMASLVLAFGAASASAAPARVAAVGVPAQTHTGRPRTTRIDLAPLPGDLALAEVRFKRIGHQRISLRSVRVSVSGGFGDDYLASASPLPSSGRGARLLILLVNRPSPLADPVNVHLLLRSARTLGVALIERLSNPFTHPHDGGAAMCGVRLRGRPLAAEALRPLQARGAPLAGFTPSAAVAAAYDVACGLPYDSAFRQLVTQAPAAPAPTPVPPAPKAPAPGPPGCSPCPPQPGIACPLLPTPEVCIAPVGGGARSAAASAH